METNRDRIKYLGEKIGQLAAEIQDKGLEDRYMNMVERIAKGKLKFEPVEDEQWEVMLPKEREKNRLAYYHTLRSELQVLKQEAQEQARKQGGLEIVTAWLENPWVKRTLTAAGITQLAIRVLEVLHTHGLFYSQDEDTNYVV
jgi:hypothetical protein